MPSPKTKQQIARELGISLRTLQRWIGKAEISVPRGLVSPKKQEELFRVLGYDSLLEQKETYT